MTALIARELVMAISSRAAEQGITYGSVERGDPGEQYMSVEVAGLRTPQEQEIWLDGLKKTGYAIVENLRDMGLTRWSEPPPLLTGDRVNYDILCDHESNVALRVTQSQFPFVFRVDAFLAP
jgi:hypothetical protein